jgi:hypothetical protein
MKLMSVALVACGSCTAQEVPYFVTYSHHMEEPGALEIDSKTATGGRRRAIDSSGTRSSSNMARRHGGYVDFTGTKDDSTVLTGFRFENRWRPLWREHWINPVL